MGKMIEKIDISKCWVEGIPDQLILSCIKCGNKVVFDYKVEDEIWGRVIKSESQRDVVCLNCFDKLAEEQGIDIGDYLEVVYYTGESKTIELRPVKECTFGSSIKS